MKSPLILIVLAITTFFSFQNSTMAQDKEVLYKFIGTLSDEDQLLGEVEINIFEENTLIQTIISDKKGKFEMLLAKNTTHTVEMNLDGYFSKRMIFITDVEDGVKKLPALKFDVSLIPNEKYSEEEKNAPESISILDFPSTIIEYDQEIGDFNYREAYTRNINEEVKKIKSN